MENKVSNVFSLKETVSRDLHPYFFAKLTYWAPDKRDKVFLEYGFDFAEKF